MRTLLLTLFFSSVFAVELDIPPNAKCLPGAVYNPDDGSCNPIDCESGIGFGFDVDGKKPCCVKCEVKQNVCLKPLTHTVRDIAGNKWTVNNLCTAIADSGSECTRQDDCVTVNGPGAWQACEEPQWLNGLTVIEKPDHCWAPSKLVSSGSRLNFGIVGIVGVGVNLLLGLSQ